MAQNTHISCGNTSQLRKERELAHIENYYSLGQEIGNWGLSFEGGDYLLADGL